MTDTVHTFGGFLPDRRIADLVGIPVDVTRIPARYSLELMKLSKAENKDEVFEQTVEVLARICQRSAPEITAEFILDNLDVSEIMELARYINEPVLEKTKAALAGVKSEPDGKNG